MTLLPRLLRNQEFLVLFGVFQGILNYRPDAVDMFCVKFVETEDRGILALPDKVREKCLHRILVDIEHHEVERSVPNRPDTSLGVHSLASSTDRQLREVSFLSSESILSSIVWSIPIMRVSFLLIHNMVYILSLAWKAAG